MNLVNVQVIGRIARTPEERFTPSGANILTFSVAVNPDYRNKEARAFFRVSVFGQRAQTLARLQLDKGTLVCVTGTLNPREYEKDGQTRTSLDVSANDVILLSKRDQSQDEPPPF